MNYNMPIIIDVIYRRVCIIMTAQEMFDQAIIELGNLKDGDSFIVKDLFKGHIWNSQNKPERLTLGTLFLNFVNQSRGKITVLSKNSSGQQEYKLVDGWSYKPLSEKSCFAKTGIMTLEKVNKDFIFVNIGTSGLDLCEAVIKTESDVEKIASIIIQTLTEWKKEDVLSDKDG